jgi:radical S-adenosyl methionine domain-containing protein 2
VQSAELLRELYKFFLPGNNTNPLSKRLNWNSVRLNLAGGEPTLHAEKLIRVVNHAHNLGFEVSLISNGSLLDKVLLKQLAPKLSWLGVSIDSAITITNAAIGRLNRQNRLLDSHELTENLIKARQQNSRLRIKINTVVNQLNHTENLSPMIQKLSPDKWKVLRMLPVVNQTLTVTDEQFSNFVNRHKKYEQIICAEDNRDMNESYLMIDPMGGFFQNSPTGQNYVYSQSILDVGAEVAFTEVNFAHERFSSRYNQGNNVELKTMQI